MKKQITIFVFVIICFFVNGQTWSPVGSGLVHRYHRIESMCEYNGELYVGGAFDSIGGIKARNIAKWNGTNWDSVPGSYPLQQCDVWAMTVYNNMLIIGGNFTLGGIPTNIIKYNGFGWALLGSGMDNRVFDLEVYNNELYASGEFNTAGGITSRGIARWNDTTWKSVGGPGLNTAPGFIGRALNVYNGELYIAGGFYQVNGQAAHSIAKWNGSTWTPLSNVIEYWTFGSLGNYHNKLYAGGNMQINNKPNLEFICSWNNSVWDSVEFGLNSSQVAMIVYNDELYVAGDFDTASTFRSYGIARWNDVQWDSVGSGLDLFHITQDSIIMSATDTIFSPTEHITAMCVYNNDLYVGGTFSMIGGINANSIAKWHMAGAPIEEQNKLSGVSVFPSPTNGEITIRSSENISAIKIINELGENIYQSVKPTVNQSFVDLSSQPNGIYFMQIISENGIVVKKIIISK